MRRIYAIILVLLALVSVTACNKDRTDEDTDYRYNIYYYNDKSDALTSEDCYIYEESQEAKANAIYNAMKNPGKDTDKSVVVNDLEIDDIVINEKIMYLYFSEEYKEMNNIEEIKFRAAVVKSMVQIEGVEYVTFYVADQPLANENGAAAGLMEDSSFILNVNDAMEEVSWQTVTIYYGDTTGKKLVGQTMNISYKNSLPIEQVVINKLIEGPDIKECSATLPKSLKILSISTKDGICYVNFDASLLTAIADVSAEVTLYSIVNTLCEISDINQVQILVNGNADQLFRENYSLSTVYERNLDIISSDYVVPSK